MEFVLVMRPARGVGVGYFREGTWIRVRNG